MRISYSFEGIFVFMKIINLNLENVFFFNNFTDRELVLDGFIRF